MTFKKLVRDNIPDIINSKGQTPKTRILHETEYIRELERKLQEEVAEYLQDKNTEELADVLEVLHALAATLGVTPQELETVRAQKAVERGGFAKRIYLEDVEK